MSIVVVLVIAVLAIIVQWPLVFYAIGATAATAIAVRFVLDARELFGPSPTVTVDAAEVLAALRETERLLKAIGDDATLGRERLARLQTEAGVLGRAYHAPVGQAHSGMADRRTGR